MLALGPGPGSAPHSSSSTSSTRLAAVKPMSLSASSVHFLMFSAVWRLDSRTSCLFAQVNLP